MYVAPGQRFQGKSDMWTQAQSRDAELQCLPLWFLVAPPHALQ